MDHVAIMKKSWGLIPKILTGEKRIESRWYQTKRTPWGKIRPGDTIYFKNSGQLVSLSAGVAKVELFEITATGDARNIIERYGKDIQMVNERPETWPRLPKYCILIFLTGAHPVDPLNIDKVGFGNPTAWVTVDNIERIKRGK